MPTISDLMNWMKENTNLSDSSIYKYSRAVHTVSEEMLEKGIIPTSLFTMSALQLDVFLPRILLDADFVRKNTTGNNMYSNALKQYRMFRNTVRDLVDKEEIRNAIEGYDSLEMTERTAIIKSRIGQGIFKRRLLDKYDSTCIITGICTPKLLIASHVKPWAVCSNEERLSAENGLLLTPTFDKLFDSGLISFSDTGNIRISSQLKSCDVAKLNVSPRDTYDLRITYQLKRNLEYHRDVIFIK